MAHFNSLLVTGNSRFLNPINGNARNGIYYVKGTQTTTTGSWTGSIPIPALYDGLTIMYYLPYNGSGDATLNLTLSDGTTTGAKNCYYSTDRLTTLYSAGQNIVMTYHPAGSISVNGTATSDDRWIVTADYYNYDYVLPYTHTSGGTAKKYISGGYLRIDLSKQWFMFNLIYANTYAGALTLNVNGNGAKPLYINGTVSSSTNYTLPRGTYLTYYDGTNYYVRTDGKITANITGDAATVGGHTVAKDVPSNAVFTDTNTIAGMTDVQLTSPTDNDLLVYDSNLSGGKLWKNAKKIVTCTKAQFDNWSANNTFPYTDCKYIVTDVNNLNTTSADIPYDSTGTASVKDKLDADGFHDYGIISISGTDSSVGTWMKSNFIYNKWCRVRISPTDSSGYYGASSVAIMYNLSSGNYGTAICTSDNITKEPMRVGQLYGGNWTFTQMPYAYQLTTPIGDKRNVATTPNDYRNKLVFQGLKQNSSIGNPTKAVTYSYVVGLCGWSDSSGGGAWEIAFNDKGIFIRREGATRNTWANWVALYSG